jgi:hypothetical protein
MNDTRSSYLEVVRRLEDSGVPLEAGSEKERLAIERFEGLLGDFKAPDFVPRIRQVYAEDVYFNDTLRTIRRVEELEAYLADSADAVEVGTVEFLDRAVANGNYYFRWEMSLRFKKLRRGVLTQSLGVSHIRFDAEGRVALHQDFWDSASGLFEHVPVVGGLIRTIKRRL